MVLVSFIFHSCSVNDNEHIRREIVRLIMNEVIFQLCDGRCISECQQALLRKGVYQYVLNCR